jgi:hypothetical protein
MTDNNGRGVSTEILEEVYQARETGDDFLRQIHDSYYHGGRYNFKLPPSWQLTQNKKIAVRRISTPANDYIFRLMISTVGVLPDNLTQQLLVNIPTNYSIQEALGAIMALSRKVGFGVSGTNPTLLAIYDAEHTVTFVLVNAASEAVDFEIHCEDDDFWHMLNTTKPTPSTVSGDEIEFKNVWDRKTLFLHSSFVSNTTAGYVGRGGEFYPKPSKMYKTDTQEFYVETSLDGYRPIPLPYENWILELALIVDADEYQSQ